MSRKLSEPRGEKKKRIWNRLISFKCHFSSGITENSTPCLMAAAGRGPERPCTRLTLKDSLEGQLLLVILGGRRRQRRRQHSGRHPQPRQPPQGTHGPLSVCALLLQQSPRNITHFTLFPHSRFSDSGSKGEKIGWAKRRATCSSAWLGEQRPEGRSAAWASNLLPPNNRFPSRGLTPRPVLALTPKIRARKKGKKNTPLARGVDQKDNSRAVRKNSLDSIPLSRSLTRLDIIVTLGTQSEWYLFDSMRVYPRQYKWFLLLQLHHWAAERELLPSSCALPRYTTELRSIQYRIRRRRGRGAACRTATNFFFLTFWNLGYIIYANSW